MAAAAAQAKPDAILLPALYRSGRDLGPRLAARLGMPIITEVTALARDGDCVKASRMLYAEKVLATFTASTPAVYTCAAGICEPIPDDPHDDPVANYHVLAPAFDPKYLESTVEVINAPASSEGSLADAKVVIAVGRGMNGDFALARQLAQELGGVIGASRAVTDAGQLPHDRQIGQTGVTVQPNVYIAIGISGAIQHLAGMKGSKYIIAINKDKDAPIFKIAHAGIIDDYKTAVPKLIEAIRKAAGA
jgi:electron transfer flavoprotein alpha subunit